MGTSVKDIGKIGKIRTMLNNNPVVKMFKAPVVLPHGPPKANISPLIKTARWTALLYGIFYGYQRYATLSEEHKSIKVYEDNYKKEFGERMKVKKAKAAEDEFQNLAKD